MSTTREERGRYLSERWALTIPAAWERPSAAAASHRALAASKRDHWLRRLRCAAGLHWRRDNSEGVGDGLGEEEPGGRRTGVAVSASMVSPTSSIHKVKNSTSICQNGLGCTMNMELKLND